MYQFATIKCPFLVMLKQKCICNTKEYSFITDLIQKLCEDTVDKKNAWVLLINKYYNYINSQASSEKYQRGAVVQCISKVHG